MEIVTQCGGWHSNEVRTFYAILVKLGQKRYSLDGFPQTLRESVKEGDRWRNVESDRYQTK